VVQNQVFELIDDEYEQVAFGHDAATGLRAIVAIHSTVLGPGMGGTRFLDYANETDALIDVLRLARGMTYKHAISGLDFGGAKAVIIGDPRRVRTEPLIEAYARFIDGLAGRYLTAEDMGTTQADMDLIAAHTPHVTGTSRGSGDPSPATAWGVYWAMRAAADHLWGSPDLGGRVVGVSGVGKVGGALVGHLVDAGAEVIVSDVRPEATAEIVERFGVDHVATVDPAASHAAPCDIWAPCALGAVLNTDTISELSCAIVCGAANNQLATPEDAVAMAPTGIVYVPDYVANAGGVMNIAEEAGGYDHDRAFRRIEGIAANVTRVFDRAAAAAEVEDRLAAAAPA